MNQYPPEALIPASIRAIFLDSFYTPYVPKKKTADAAFSKTYIRIYFVFDLLKTKTKPTFNENWGVHNCCAPLEEGSIGTRNLGSTRPYRFLYIWY